MKQPVAKKAVNALSKPSFEDYYKSIPEYKNDTVSYDLQSAYEELPYSQMKRFAESNAHLPDTYKKPTHPTFSNESKYHNDKTPGGYWDRDTKGRDRFTPSQYNIDNMGGPKEYMKWFQENEKGVILNMPYEQTQPTSFINNYFEDVVRAEKGLSLGFRTGEKWSVVEDLKGPSHADGGIDLFFNTDGLSFSRYGKTIKAEKGLIITNGVISGGDLSKLGAGVRPSADANTSNAPTSTIQPVNPNINTSLIGKTWDDIPSTNPAYNQPQLKQDTRTDYEREQDQKAMEDYQNPTILDAVFGGARMVTRAVADPIQGVGQIFDAVGLGDTRIGQDLGNFNDEEAAYRYRNVNPNTSAGEKFMGNLGEGSEVAAWGATNFIPFESSVINPIVKGLVGKGNYSSYIANPLYTPVVNQGVKEVVENSVVNQIDDDILKNIKKIDKSPLNNTGFEKILRKVQKQNKLDQKYKDNRLFDDFIDEIIEEKISDDNLNKAAKWDNEYGSDIYGALMDLKKGYEYQNLAINGKSPYPFDVDVFTKQKNGRDFKIAGYAGYKNKPIDYLDYMKKHMNYKDGKLSFNDDFIYNINDRILGIRKSSIKNPKDAKRVIAHELGHITEGNKKWSDKMNERFLEIMKNPDDLIQKNIRDPKSINKTPDELIKDTKFIEYYTTPTEISQHGITNMRQELLDKNFISSIDDDVTEEIINKFFKYEESGSKLDFVSKRFFEYVDKSKSNVIAKLINEYPKSIVPAGVATAGAIGASQQNK